MIPGFSNISHVGYFDNDVRPLPIEQSLQSWAIECSEEEKQNRQIAKTRRPDGRGGPRAIRA